jgi:hypothetical protein
MADQLLDSGVTPDGQDSIIDGGDTGDDGANSGDVKIPEGMVPKGEVDGLFRALRAERESRKQFEKELAEQKRALEKFKEINPDEYRRLQEEAAIAERERQAAEERTALLEEKYGAQARQAKQEAEQHQRQLLEFRKRYALEKVFIAAEGRPDAQDGVSFFDMMADRIGSEFRLESNGTVTVIDRDGNPVMDSDTGRRVDPVDYIAGYKKHPIYGTFFRGSKGSGSGLGLGASGLDGVTADDLLSKSSDEMFEAAFS